MGASSTTLADPIDIINNVSNNEKFENNNNKNLYFSIFITFSIIFIFLLFFIFVKNRYKD